MSDALQERAREALTAVIDPYLDKNIVDAGWVRGVACGNDQVAVDVVLGYYAQDWSNALSSLIKQKLAEAGIAGSVEVSSRISAHQVQGELAPHPEIKNVIAVASGKGGVGKSTTAVNLAGALHLDGAKVGILDADMYGPSLPTLTQVSGKPDISEQQLMIPKEHHGLQVMSIGLLAGEHTPVIWRGPMATQALQQMFGQTQWSTLDYLIVDMPPGTGDIQLTLCQRIPVSGSIIVTTPQDLAVLDAQKGLEMFRKIGIPVLGVVENMAMHACSQCGHIEHIFGQHGGQRIADQYGVPLLASLPLDAGIRAESDRGTPFVFSNPASPITGFYRTAARRVAAFLSQQPKNKKIPVATT